MKNEGVTLAELMIAIAVIAVLTAVALPDMAARFSRDSLCRVVDEMACFISRARLDAMRDSARWRVIFVPAERSYYCFEDCDDDQVRDPGEPQRGPHSLPAGIEFGCSSEQGPNATAVPADGVSLTADTLVFSQMGTCNSGTVYLRNESEDRAIRILPASGTVVRWEHRGSWRVSR